MNWKQESMEELREYEAKRIAAINLPDEIARLKADAVKRCGSNKSAPVKDGGTGWDDRQINMLVKCSKLEASLAYTKAWVSNVERGLASLNAEERLILERFYINSAKGSVDRLCNELYLEKTAIYDRKDAALRKYTLARYGRAEL